MAGPPPDDSSRPALFANTLKVAVAAALISYVATHWLSPDGVAPPGSSHVAATPGPPVEDPVATGSIVPSARQTRIDPCAMPPPR